MHGQSLDLGMRLIVPSEVKPEDENQEQNRKAGD